MELWDGIFACEDELRLMDYIAVSMIRTVRDELMQGDLFGMLKTLKGFAQTSRQHISVERSQQQIQLNIELLNPKLLIIKNSIELYLLKVWSKESQGNL